MAAIKPDEGYITVSIDLAAGEPTVTSHFSRDPNYIYACFDGVGKVPFYSGSVLKIDDIYLMSCSISPVGAQQMRQAFEQKWPAGTFQDQWMADAEVIKKALKKTRQQHKILCLSGDTMIRVKGKGYVPIDKVEPGATVWDGEKWVPTEGCVYKGEAEVINVDGVLMTPDHLVLTHDGWRKAEDLSRDRHLLKKECQRLYRPSGSWAEVWTMANHVLRSPDTWKAPIRLCKRWVCDLLAKLRHFE
jgi:hypothetical protein